jgi:hypothetical protein
MSTFRTEFNTRLHKTTIPLSSKIITIGSCFAYGIGNRLLLNKFDTLVNPFGTTYNPISIHKLIRMAIHNQPSPGEMYLFNQEVFSNYDFHSSFSALNRSELETNINNVIGTVHHALRKSTTLFLTYGTSWVYERKDIEEVVSNCHKQPADLFNKTLLDTHTIEQSFGKMYQELRAFNPDLRIILTLSPVRHLKDTLELNSVSKSMLRVACHAITRLHADVDYFPAYEIMMDDLRDYRFYASDMIHPSIDAENYIWEKFRKSYFSKETIAVLNEWQEVKRMMDHKPFHPESASHQEFLKDIRAKLEALHLKLDVSTELRHYL